VEMSIEKLEGTVGMKITDNGKGFLAERVFRARKNQRLGLLGMRERLEMVGGNFTIQSVPGKGTTITVQVPFGNTHPKADYVRLAIGRRVQIGQQKEIAPEPKSTT